MKKILISCMVLACAACGELPEDEASAVDPTAPAIEVTSVELAQAYADNEVAAQQKYGSSPLLVSGTINSIELDFMDEPVVTLPGTDDFTTTQASFAGDASEVTASLQKGQAIVLRCAGVSEVMGSPMLSDCTVAE